MMILKMNSRLSIIAVVSFLFANATLCSSSTDDADAFLEFAQFAENFLSLESGKHASFFLGLQSISHHADLTRESEEIVSKILAKKSVAHYILKHSVPPGLRSALTCYLQILRKKKEVSHKRTADSGEEKENSRSCAPKRLKKVSKPSFPDEQMKFLQNLLWTAMSRTDVVRKFVERYPSSEPSVQQAIGWFHSTNQALRNHRLSISRRRPLSK